MAEVLNCAVHFFHCSNLNGHISLACQMVYVETANKPSGHISMTEVIKTIIKSSLVQNNSVM